VSWEDWSYIRNDRFKTVDELIHELVDIVSKNGVLLLDIGPRPDGSIPPEPQALLRGVGLWLKVNGDAIYGTRPCWSLGFGEGSHNSGGGGFSDRAVEYDPHDFRFTQKGNVIYAIAMKWPDVEDHFLIRAFNDHTPIASNGITGINLLGSSESLNWKLTADGLSIARPKHMPCDSAFSFRITLGGISVEKLSADRATDRQIRVTICVRNLDPKPARQTLEFFDNSTHIGSQTFNLAPSETVTRSLLLDDPVTKGSATPTIARFTAAIPNGKPFAPQAQILTPPKLAASKQFNGDTMLAGKGLGKFSQLTYSVWTQTDDLREDFTALLNTAGWENGGLHIQYLAAGNLQVSFKTPAGQAVNGRSSAVPGRASGWQLITVTYDAAKQQAVIFVNGNRDTEMKIDQATPVNLDAFTLGGWTSGGRRFVGRMTDPRLYNRVLTPDEIEALLRGEPVANGLVTSFPSLRSTLPGVGNTP
jgi:hypothetical protein